MESFGIEDPLHGWFTSYLSDKSHRVLLNGKGSPWRAVTAGVPQGSILLAITIVDDLNSDPSLFADDTSLLKVINNQSDVLSVTEDLRTIEN